MPDDVLDPVPSDRVLTTAEADAYALRLGSVGFAFTVAGDATDPMGFDVTGNGQTFNYRFDATATTAVELMERICAERGC